MKYFLSSIIIFALFLNTSCKKSDTVAPIPIVTPKPDTLTAGWKKVALPYEGMGDIFFQNSSTGYLVARNGIYKSVDGGATWGLVFNKTADNIAVTANGNAFFAGEEIYKTTTAGGSFTSLPFTNISDIYFVNNSEGFFIDRNNRLFKTIDAGVSWQMVVIPLPGIGTNFGYSSFCFNSATNGIIVNSSGAYKSTGGIAVWQPVTFLTGNPSTNVFYSAFYTPNNNAYISNNVGQLFKSVDGGANFSLIQSFPNPVGFCDIHFVDNNVGYVSLGNRIYKTTDAGMNWAVVVALGEGNVLEIHFTDATHGWACGYNGFVLLFN